MHSRPASNRAASARALAIYTDRAEFRAEYPELEDEDIRQALAYAAANLDDRVLELRPAV